MNATTTTDSDRDTRRTRPIARHRVRGRCERRDPTVPARVARTAVRDDRTHTPPHGDAVLPHRTGT